MARRLLAHPPRQSEQNLRLDVGQKEKMKIIIALCMLFIGSMARADNTNNESTAYSGIGIAIATNAGLQVMRVAKGSPADIADIHSFDKILQIDGRDTSNMTLGEASSLLKGPEGSTATLLILSITNGTKREVTMTRARFDNQNEISWKREVLTSLQLSGSTNIHHTINEKSDAQPCL